MTVLVLSAAFVGLIHSLSPGHWLPVVLVVKSHRWGKGRAILGAAAAASGHLFISTVLGVLAIVVGAKLFADHENEFERYSGIALALFGLAYAAFSYFRHESCHGHHSHHGPEPKKDSKAPFLFLFTLGFSPCVAVLPVFLTASAKGYFAAGITLIAFCLGVLTALIGATLLTVSGLVKLDHPILEHYGDVIAGLGITGMGIFLYFYPL